MPVVVALFSVALSIFQHSMKSQVFWDMMHLVVALFSVALLHVLLSMVQPSMDLVDVQLYVALIHVQFWEHSKNNKVVVIRE